MFTQGSIANLPDQNLEKFLQTRCRSFRCPRDCIGSPHVVSGNRVLIVMGGIILIAFLSLVLDSDADLYHSRCLIWGKNDELRYTERVRTSSYVYM